MANNRCNGSVNPQHHRITILYYRLGYISISDRLPSLDDLFWGDDGEEEESQK